MIDTTNSKLAEAFSLTPSVMPQGVHLRGVFTIWAGPGWDDQPYLAGTCSCASCCTGWGDCSSYWAYEGALDAYHDQWVDTDTHVKLYERHHRQWVDQSAHVHRAPYEIHREADRLRRQQDRDWVDQCAHVRALRKVLLFARKFRRAAKRAERRAA